MVKLLIHQASHVSNTLMQESLNAEKEDSQVNMAVIPKNRPSKFFKLLNIADECCYKSCDNWQYEYHE